MSNIVEAKQKLPLPLLMQQLGLADHAKKSARCPFHDDQHNSFSVWRNDAGLWFWKCHTGCGEGDEINFLEKHKGISRSDATKQFLELAGVVRTSKGLRPQRANDTRPVALQSTDEFLSSQECHRAIEMAITLRETPNLCERIARARGWKPETIRDLTVGPYLGWHDGKLAFIYETGVKLRWQKDGERVVYWAFGKPWLWRGSLIDIATTVYLCEGETDAISLIDAGLESDGRTVAVALPSATSFNERWADLFLGKEVILAFDADKAGREATHRVSRLLRQHVASLKQLNWQGLQRAS
jgi:5S rRNA maturation endonuclease (ribonuclease M5)